MYKAVVTKLEHVREHPNADRLRLATVMGNQVVVGLTAQDGDVGVFFPTDGQLSQEYADANDLVGVWKDGKKVGGGFFTEKRRVKAQNFRGERSDGYWAEASTLEFTGKAPTSADVGHEFDEWNGVPICNKYFTPKTQRAMGQRKAKRGETKMFAKHFDTKQLRFYDRILPKDGIITLTEKLHGTSGRYGHVLEPKTERWYHKLLGKEPKSQWQYLMGTRNVIVEQTDGQGYYGGQDFRYKAVEDVSLRKGEVIYFELVGWVNETTPIMPSVKTKLLPEIQERYGEQMPYTYGCEPGECKLYVYRIAMVTEDGTSIDLTWEQVKRRCGELDLLHVPELVASTPMLHWHWLTGENVIDVAEDLAKGASTLDNRHIREGVCVRVDHSELTPMVLKHKSYEFGVLEGYIKTDDEYVDLEEIS